MILSSPQARQVLRHLQQEIDRIRARNVGAGIKEHARLVDLLIHRNLLRSVLAGREMESGKKVVSLEVWRLGLAPPREMARFGYRVDEAPTATTWRIGATAPM